MKSPHKNLRTAPGNALAPVLIILGALAISALIFFFYTRDHVRSLHQAGEGAKGELSKPALHQSSPDALKPSVVAGDGSTGPLPKLMTGSTASPASAPEAMPSGFSKPGDLGDLLARAMASGDIATATKLLAGGQASQEIVARNLLENLARMGYKVVAPEQIRVVGQIEGATRLSIPLVNKETGKPGTTSLMVEVERDPKMGYKITRVRLPKELEAAAAPAMAALPAATPGTPVQAASPGPAVMVAPGIKSLVVVDESPDSLAFASNFVQVLLKLDYEGVRKLVNEEKVPAMKLAALCIAFEEGRYKLLEAHPLMATVASDKTSWVIAYVHSDILQEDTEFGLEMEFASNQWRVSGLNLSKLLVRDTKSRTLGDIPYTPLVLNPKGKESIALYFEYDQALLHPRAQQQLNIVAAILKAASHKKLKIVGHTDALGSDNYNIALSQHRAEAVKDYMLAHGVPADQVETIGFGKKLPLRPNVNPDGSDNPTGRSHNRRAEILLDF